MLQKIISGGQTGADLGGLIAAKLHGLDTGGWMPNTFRNHNGSNSHYAKLFGMQEHESYEYKPRTYKNIENSDGTIRIAVDFCTAGEKCTLNGIKHYSKPYADIQVCMENPQITYDMYRSIARFINDHEIETLNIAGNSDRTWPGMRHYTTTLLSYVFLMMDYPRIRWLPKDYSEFHVMSY